MKKPLAGLLVTLVIILIFALIGKLTNKFTIGGTCDFQGGWGRGTYSMCDCFGKEITIDDSLEIDGDYHTRCVGVGFYTTYDND